MFFVIEFVLIKKNVLLVCLFVVEVDILEKVLSVFRFFNNINFILILNRFKCNGKNNYINIIKMN